MNLESTSVATDIGKASSHHPDGVTECHQENNLKSVSNRSIWWTGFLSASSATPNETPKRPPSLPESSHTHTHTRTVVQIPHNYRVSWKKEVPVVSSATKTKPKKKTTRRALLRNGLFRKQECVRARFRIRTHPERVNKFIYFHFSRKNLQTRWPPLSADHTALWFIYLAANPSVSPRFLVPCLATNDEEGLEKE